MESSAADVLVEELQQQIETILGSFLPPGTRVALVNFPNHRNAGDPAIWLGQERILRRLGVSVGYRASWASYRSDDLRSAAPEGPILIQGGGNLGDAYRGQQGTREKVLVDFPGRPVIQLPQSLWFRDPDELSRVAGLFAAHGDARLLVRDEQSLDVAAASFDVPVDLCPDMAFGMGRIDRPCSPETDIVWLRRRDIESSVGDLPPASDAAIVDWLEDVPDEPSASVSVRAIGRLNAGLTERMADGRTDRWGGLLARTFDPLARHWVRRGCLILSRGRVVVTDRLHGHVLALLMGIPHVVMDNANGKVGALYDTWTSASPLVQLAKNQPEALDLARALVADLDGAPS